jgi:hypothetical protein
MRVPGDPNRRFIANSPRQIASIHRLNPAISVIDAHVLLL